MKPATYYVPSALVAPLKTIASAYGQMHANDKMDNLDVKAKGVDDVINVSASFIVYRALVWTLPLSGGGGGSCFSSIFPLFNFTCPAFFRIDRAMYRPRPIWNMLCVLPVWNIKLRLHGHRQ